MQLKKDKLFNIKYNKNWASNFVSKYQKKNF